MVVRRLRACRRWRFLAARKSGVSGCGGRGPEASYIVRTPGTTVAWGLAAPNYGVAQLRVKKRQVHFRGPSPLLSGSGVRSTGNKSAPCYQRPGRFVLLRCLGPVFLVAVLLDGHCLWTSRLSFGSCGAAQPFGTGVHYGGRYWSAAPARGWSMPLGFLRAGVMRRVRGSRSSGRRGHPVPGTTAVAADPS